MEISVTMEGPSVGAVMESTTKKLTPATVKEVLRLANEAGAEVARQAIALLPGGTGALARSFLPARLLPNPDGVSAGALSGLPYARMQDTGGKIYPVAGKNLAIPVTAKAKKMWPRDWPKGELFLVPCAKGTFLMSPGKRKPKLQYVLKESVTLKGTGYIASAAEAVEAKADSESAKRITEDVQEGE